VGSNPTGPALSGFGLRGLGAGTELGGERSSEKQKIQRYQPILSWGKRKNDDMDFVRLLSKIGAPDRSKVMEVKFLIDTGSWYLVLQPGLAKELNIKPVGRAKLTLADKRVVEADLAPVYVSVLDREMITLAALMETPEPLLGTSTLEALGLALDPTTGEVKPVGPALLTV